MTNQTPIHGLHAEEIRITGHGGYSIPAYLTKPLAPGPHPAVLVIHEAFGMVEHTRELAHRFAAAGYLAIAPDLYSRMPPFEPTDMPSVMAAMQGLPDVQALGDLEAAAEYVKAAPESNGKVGVIGHCSGGRHTALLACNSEQVDAAVDCYGGGVVTDEVTEARPVPVIQMLPRLHCPLLGLFGETDRNPNPEHVASIEAALQQHGKQYEVHTYPAPIGHGFFADYRPSYSQEAAVDGWQRIFAFFDTHLR